MDDLANTPTSPPKSRRRWLSFGLRTVMIAVTLFCVWLGITASRANRQRRAVETIKKVGGRVLYEYEADEDGRAVQKPLPPPGPDWLRNLIGIDYFTTVVGVVKQNENDINDDSVEALADLSQLNCLILLGNGVTDSRLTRLKGLTQLHILEMPESSVSDAGWAPLEHFTHLKELLLGGPNVSDSTLEQIKDLTDLTDLALLNTQVTDSGLKHLMGLSRLERATLGSDRITDDGLQHLTTLSHLRGIDISETKVTDAGAKVLQRARPNVTVSLH